MEINRLHIVLIILLILCITDIGNVLCWKDDSYRAAVVEYTPKMAKNFNATKEEALAIMHYNVGQFEKFVKEAKQDRVDIIVFPEYGLFGPTFPTRASIFPFLEMIPNADSNPCLDLEIYPYLNITHRLSCIARENSIVMIVDMGDLQWCTKWDSECPKDRKYQFNTMVAFGTEGQILSKYYKSNLYFEPQFDVPVNQRTQVFQVHPNVKFGMIICFDIMFAKPQIELLKNDGMTDLLFSTWWVNTPPLLTSTQIQQGWSRSFGINLVAANSGYNRKISGTGIFAAGGKILQSFTNPTMDPISKMLISDVPIFKRSKTHLQVKPNAKVDIANAKRLEMNLDTKAPLDLVARPLRIWDNFEMNTDTVKNDQITCTVTYRVSHTQRNNSSNETVIIYAATGHLTPLFPSIACGVATCNDENPNKCITLVQSLTQTLNAKTLFDVLDVHAHYTEESIQGVTVYPVSSMDQGELYPNDQLQYTRHSTTHHSLSSSTLNPVTMLHIGFLGRNLELSG